MEKADILEMTVRYLRHARRTSSVPDPHPAPTEDHQQSGTAIKAEPGVTTNNHAYQFHSGYRACVNEISAFLESNTLPKELKQRLLGNIMRGSERLSGGVQQAPMAPATPARVPGVYQVPDYQCCVTSPASPSTMDIQCTLSVATPSAPKHFSARVVSSTTKPRKQHHHHPQQCMSSVSSSMTDSVLRAPVSSSPVAMSTPPAYKSHFAVQSPSVSFAVSSPLWRPW